MLDFSSLTWVFDLQRFAEKDVDTDEDVVDTDDEDIVDDDEDVVTDDDSDDDDDQGDDDDDELPKGKKKKDDEVTFTEAQKKVVEDMIQNRLERADRRLDQQYRNAAGVEVNRNEVFAALDLWGFLKLNPQLSDNVQRLIDEVVSKGNFVKQDKRENSAKEDALGKREAVLDLKATDTYFARHSKDILDWAEDEGFDIVDAKTLKQAYMAYRGSKGVLDRADAEHRKKQQAKAKNDTRKQAKMATGKSKNGKRNADFTKMSDADVLAATGHKLFTDD